MFIHSEDREILRDLYSSIESIDVYQFHDKYMLSPGQVARVIRKYEKSGVIEMEGGSISITKMGRKWLIKNRREIFFSVNRDAWEHIPDEFLSAQNKENYIPKWRTLRQFYKK
jgi:DNA-binding PadR family transcriptional regulator